jgi:hypothetical protein
LPLFDSFALSIVILAIAAAFYILLSDTPLEIEPQEQKVSWMNTFRERAARSAGARIAVATMVAAVFGVLEYLSHRVVLSLGMSADVQAVWDGAVVAIAAASLAWMLLVGQAPMPQESTSREQSSDHGRARTVSEASFKPH